MKNLIYLLNITIISLVLSASKCHDDTVTPDSCTECPTITSVSPSIGFAGDSVKIVGTKFKGLKTVYFGTKEVSSFNLSTSGDTVIVEVPQAETGKEKDSVVVSVALVDPNKPSVPINSNVKGKFKYAEVIVENYAGKLGQPGNSVDVDRQQALLNSPYNLVLDKEGNLYFIDGSVDQQSVKMINKLGKITVKYSNHDIRSFIASNGLFAFFTPFRIQIDKNNNLLYLGTNISSRSSSAWSVIRKARLEFPLNNDNFNIVYSQSSSNHNPLLNVNLDEVNNTLLISELVILTKSPILKKHIISNGITSILGFANSYDIYNNKNDAIYNEGLNLFIAKDFKQPVPILDNTFRDIKGFVIDRFNRLVLIERENFMIIPSLRSSPTKSAITVRIPSLNSAYIHSILEIETGIYLVADTQNHRILKISLK